MAEVIITAIEGQASLTRFESGETIALTVGVVVYEGDVISTETGTQVTVRVDGQLRILPANTNTTFPLQLDFTDSNSDDEFAVFDESLEALAATLETQPDQSESNTDFLDLLEGEEDILESLEATAAGLDGGAGTEGGSNFVRVGRINEDVNPVGFQFAPNATDNNELEPNNVNGTGEQAQDITIVLDSIGLTSDPTPTVTGTTSAIPGSTVTLTITDSEGNVQTLTTSVTADNTFSADVLEALSDGAFTVDVTVTEPTGNTADNSTTGEIDTTAPLITIDTIGTLSDTTPTITGTTDATAGTTVTLVITDSEGNTQTVTTTVQDDGTYSATVPESLVEGDFIVNASVTDEVGNTATAESAGIINVTPPTITIDSIALGNDTTPTISGTTDAEPGSVVSLTITDSNGNTQVIEATVQVDGSYSADTQVELSDGEFTVLASVTNQIGNTATATAQGEVDTQAPNISINDPGNNGDSTPNISGTTDAAPGSEITIIVTDSSGAVQTITTTVLADGTFSIDVPNAVTQGEFSVLASVSDSAGNTAETQANGIFDPSSPVLNVDVTSPTNDATPEISGETDAPAGSNVVITVTDSEGNEQTFTTIVDETGNFSETVPTELNEGDFSVVVSVTTPTGESATVTVTGEIDQTSPVIEISPIGSSNDDTPLIEGTTDALPNTTVTLEITDSNGVVQSVNVLVQEDGTFSVETPEQLAEGDFTVSATVTDAAGNVGTTSINAVIDTSGPSIVIETGSPTNGSEGIGGSSDAPNAEIVVVITDNEGNTVTIVDTTDENGEFNVDIPDSIQEGDIDVEVTVTDDTGNSTTTDATIELDVTPPTVTLTPQAEGNDNTPTISGTTDASTTDDIVITIIDSQGEQQTIITNADENGNFSVDVGEPLNEGSYQVTVEITDEAGNTATVVDNGGIVDTTPPVISLQPQEITNDPTPQISGTTDLAAGTTISITVTDSQNNTQNFDIDVDENGDFNTTVPVELSEGPFTVVVSATDNAGNTASAQDSNGVIDLTAPDAPSIDAGNGTVITGTAEANAVVDVDIDGDGTPDLTTTADDVGNWSVTPDTPLADGTEVTATATDAAGNTSAPVSDTVNAAAPLVSIDDVVTSDTTPALTGNVDDPTATVVVTIDGQDYTATNNGDGTWTLADDTVDTLAEDSYSATVTATDLEGNSSTANGTVTIDTTAPAAPTIDAGNGTVITGTAEANAVVDVDVDGDGTPDLTTTADDVGNWSVTPDTPLADGTEVTATATDAAGNTSAPVSDTVNAAAPLVSIDDVVTSDTTPALTGNVDDPTATVVVTIDGQDYTATNNGDGTWTLADDTVDTLAEDSYSATVTATDLEGNSSTANGTVIIDTTAPAVPSIDAGNGTEITGTAEANAVVDVDIDGDGTPDLTTTADGDGNWSVTPDTPLADGTVVTATATDAAGNTSAPASDTVDAVAPVVSINDVVTSDTTPALTGNVDDPTATVVVTIDGQDYTATNNGDGTWTLADDTVDALPEDSYSATVTATDLEGNSSTANGTVTIDTTAPAAPTIDAGNGTVITGTAEANAVVEVDIDGDGTPDLTTTADDVGNWSVTPDTPLADGTEVTATATDAAGNTSAPVSDTVNAAAPLVSIDDVVTSDTTPALTGNVDDPTATVVVTIDGQDYTATNNGDGTWTLADDTVDTLAEDSYSATVTATDLEGNSSTANGTVIIDTTAPAAPTIDAGNGTEITGTAEANAVVEVDIDGDGTPDLTTTADGDGNWSVTPDTPLTDGTEVTATATDAAGNTSAPASDTVDAVAPVVSINDVVTSDTTPALTGNVDDPTATVVVTIDGQDYTATNNGDGTWTLADDTVDALAEDSYSTIVTATDLEGNSSTANGTVIIDTTAPAAPTIDAGNGTVITGTAEANAVVDVDIDGDGTPDLTTTADDVGNWSVTPDTPLADGTEVTATATDAAGNTSAPVSDTVNAAAPLVSIDDVVTSDTTPALTGNVDDPTATVVVTINGQDYTATNNGDGTWTLADDTVDALAEDSYSTIVTATDLEGNSSTANGTVVIDTTAPASPTIDAGNGTVITGTAEANAVVEVDIDGDGTPDLTTTADDVGNWSVTPDTPLADGTEVTATATDAAGNTSAPVSDTVNAAAPVVTIDDVITSDTTPALTGNVDDPTATVVVTIDGQDYTATNNGDGTWTLADDTVDALAEDSYSATVTATDLEGNSSTANGTVTIDTTAPAAPTIDAGNGTEITGTAEANAVVDVDIDGDGTPDLTTTADGDGNWSVTPDTPLADGTEVTATATDAAGNTSTPASDTVDAVAPVVSINDVVTSDTTPALTGNVDDPTATVVVTINGQDYTATNNGDGTWTLADDTVDALPEDSYSATVTATDTDGNSASNTGTVVIDQTAPAAPTIDAGNGTVITGTAEANAVVDVDVDGDGTPDLTTTADDVGNWSVTPDTPLADGTEVTATATDAAGNTSAPVSDTVNAAAPLVSIDDVVTSETTPALAGNVDDPTATVVVTINGQDYTATNNGDGTWTLADNTVDALAEDSYSATVTATDLEGNSSTANGTVIIDTTAPAAPSIDAGNGTEVTGTAEANAVIEVDVDGDGTPDLTTTADGDGNWSVTPDTPLADGTVVTATATDAAGNTSAPASDTVDAVAPVVSINDVVTSDTTPALTGNVDDPTATVVVTIEGQDYTATNNGDGTWTLADNTVDALPEDSYSATVTATDTDGNSASNTGTVVIDQTAPAAPTIDAGNGTEITGTAEANAVIEVDVDGDGTPDLTTTADGDGNWSVTPDTPLADGTVVTATATDAAGNTSAPVSDTVDAVAPVVSIDDVVTSDSTPALTGNVDDLTATVVVTINGQDYTATNNGDGTWTLADDTVAALPEDSYSATVTATDTDGNSASNTGTVVIDQTAPAAPTIDAGNGTVISGTAEANAVVDVDIDGDGIPDLTTTADDVGNWSVTPDTPLADGTEVTATATDAAGNTSAPVSDTVNAAAPLVSIDDVVTSDTTPALTGNVDDPTATVVVTINGVDYPATNNGDGTWTLADNTVDALAEDSYSATVTATDLEGNSSTANGTVIIDTTAPAAPTVDAGNGTEITGTAEANAVIEVDVDGDGTPDLTTTADGDGNWSVTPDTPLADGTVVTATATDAAGNTSAPASDTVDAVAPVVSINDVVTSDTTPALTGNVDDPTATVVVTINGQDYAATNNGDGTWTLADDTVAALPEDSYSATVTATDTDGNSASNTGTVVIDQTAPAAPTIDAGNGTEITGTAEANAVIEVDVDGDGIPDLTTTADGDGNWSVTPDTPLANGTVVTATATDAAGNTSAPASDTVDAVAPVVSINDVVTSDTTPALTGNVNDPTATVVVTINGQDYNATNNGDGTWTLADDTVAALPEDSYSATVTATDTDGNSASNTGTVVIDQTAPAAPTIDAGNGTVITGTAEANAVVDVDIDGDGIPDLTTTADDVGNWSVTPDTPLADGTEVTATATDAAGNTSAPVSDTVNAAAPLVSIDDVVTSDTTPALTGNVDDPTATVVVTINGVDYPATNNGDGTWTLADNTVAALPEDSYSVTVTATDTANNSSTANGTVVIDTTVPAAPTIDAGNGTEISGTAEPNTVVNIDLDGDGTPDVTVNCDASGNWSFTPNPALADGTEVTATCTDAAGNTSPPASDTVDAIAPVVSVDDLITRDTTPELTGNVDDPTATVVVTINNISYTATNNGDGTWTLADDVIAALSEGSFSVSVTATDDENNVGNASGTVLIDTTIDENNNGQTVTFDSISNDSGIDGDFVTSDTTLIFNGTVDLGDDTSLTVTVDGTVYTEGSSPELTIDGSGNWRLDLTATSLAVGTYAVVATVSDAAGNTASTTSQNVVVQALDAVNDANAIDMGDPVVTANAPQTTSNVEVIGLLDSTDGADASATFTISPDHVGEVQIDVDQISLVAVADAYSVEVYDDNGQLIYKGVSANSELADVGGLDIFNVTGDQSISISLSGVAAGNYKVVVRNDENKLEELLDGDGNGDVTLTELGEAGVVLGPNNQDVVLNTIESTLNGGVLGIPVGIVGTQVRGVLESLLDKTTVIGVGELVNVLTAPLDAIGLTSFLGDILSEIAKILLSNTVTLLQDTDITTTVTEYTYTGNTVASGNLIDGDNGGVGTDTIIDGARASVVTNASGDSVAIPTSGTVTIQGEYGILEVAADGSYTYTAFGDRNSVGQTEVFTYTLSDGETSDIASLSITISGSGFPPVVAQDDTNNIELGAQTAIVNASVSDSDHEVLGLLDGSPSSGSPTAATPFTVGVGYSGEVVVEVSQKALVAVADAYIVEIVDASGNIVATAKAPDDPLVGDVAGLNVLGIVGNDTLHVKFAGLLAGDYAVVVRYDESVLESLFDQNSDGSVSLTELGDGGVVLGPDNQDAVLTAVENALNNDPGLLLGTTVRGILETALSVTDSIGAGDLVGTISNGLSVLGLDALLDTVLGALAGALLSNTLTVLQQTEVTTTLTEYAFVGTTTTTGNVIDGAINGDGIDSIVEGGVVTHITHLVGGEVSETVTVLDSDTSGVTISGSYGDLTIFEDGSYIYVDKGFRDGLGETDTFTYTISDGRNSSTASLNFSISGQGISSDTASAELTYDFVTTQTTETVLTESWGLTLFPQPFSQSQIFQIFPNEEQDLEINISSASLVDLLSSLELIIEVDTPSGYVPVRTFNSTEIVELLGLGGSGVLTVDNLVEGSYKITLNGNTGVSVGGNVSVDVTTTTTKLTEFEVASVQATTGSLLQNDVVIDNMYTLSVSTNGVDFQAITTSTLLVGQHGTLQIDENGNYTYTPDSNTEVFNGTLTETFSYRLAYSDGTIEQADFTITITSTGEGVTEVSGNASSSGEAEIIDFAIADAQVALSISGGDNDTIALPEEGDNLTIPIDTGVTMDSVELDFSPETLVLPSLNTGAVQVSSDNSLPSGTAELNSSSVEAGSNEIGAASSTESEVLKTAIDKPPLTDI